MAPKVMRMLFWQLDPHPPPRNANNIEHYTFVTLFSRKSDTPHPHLRYVTLEWPQSQSECDIRWSQRVTVLRWLRAIEAVMPTVISPLPVFLLVPLGEPFAHSLVRLWHVLYVNPLHVDVQVPVPSQERCQQNATSE